MKYIVRDKDGKIIKWGFSAIIDLDKQAGEGETAEEVDEFPTQEEQK